MRASLVVPALLLLLPSCGKKEPGRIPGNKPGNQMEDRPPVAARFEGIEVPKAWVEAYVPFLLSMRPSLAPDSARRFILLRYAFPMAWALKKEPEGFRRSRKKAEEWLREIRRGKTTLLDLVRRQLREFGQDPSLAEPLETTWTGLPLPLAKAALSAPRGKVQGPVRIPQGWCIFQVQKIRKGLTRDQDSITILNVVAPPDGKDFWEELVRFRRKVGSTRGGIEVLDPAYREVVPLVMQKRRPKKAPEKTR